MARESAVERTWHMYDSPCQMLAWAFRQKVLQPFLVLFSFLGSGTPHAMWDEECGVYFWRSTRVASVLNFTESVYTGLLQKSIPAQIRQAVIKSHRIYTGIGLGETTS